jgi:hypothetical protein
MIGKSSSLASALGVSGVRDVPTRWMYKCLVLPWSLLTSIGPSTKLLAAVKKPPNPPSSPPTVLTLKVSYPAALPFETSYSCSPFNPCDSGSLRSRCSRPSPLTMASSLLESLSFCSHQISQPVSMGHNLVCVCSGSALATPHPQRRRRS